ncbi:DUF6226 family protein [Cryobacterium sp. Y11]|uniref:DUF6226 family protein n=1 Tax=Cryobacterium sp. Y11 TaxID=2045016 RepID=UPI000CE43814
MGVYRHVGLLHDFHFPVCGCDACDNDVTDLVEDFEWSESQVRLLSVCGWDRASVIGCAGPLAVAGEREHPLLKNFLRAGERDEYGIQR